MLVREDRIDELMDRHFASIRLVDQQEADAEAFYGFHARIGSAVTACAFLLGALRSGNTSQLHQPADMACQSLIHCLVTCGPSGPEGRLPDEEAIRESIHGYFQRLSQASTPPTSPLANAMVEILSKISGILMSTGSATLLMDSLEYAEALEMVAQGASIAAELTLAIEDGQASELSP